MPASLYRRVLFTLVCLLGLIGPLWLRGQQPKPASPPLSPSGRRLAFDVVQSFDAKYEGDTPGHLGRVGGLQNTRPNIALGDPIYRGEAQVGKVTGLTWNRTNGSLDIEFDPLTMARIAVGDEVWLNLGEPAATRANAADAAK